MFLNIYVILRYSSHVEALGMCSKIWKILRGSNTIKYMMCLETSSRFTVISCSFLCFRSISDWTLFFYLRYFQRPPDMIKSDAHSQKAISRFPRGVCAENKNDSFLDLVQVSRSTDLGWDVGIEWSLSWWRQWPIDSMTCFNQPLTAAQVIVFAWNARLFAGAITYNEASTI